MRRIAPVVAGLLAACASSTSNSAASAPAPATPTRVSYMPDTVSYHGSVRRHVEQEINGQTNSNDLVSHIWVTTAIAKTDDSMHATLTLDSLTATSPGISSSDLDQAKGAVFHGTLLPTGELEAFSGPAASSPILTQVTNSLKTFFPRLPDNGAAPGDAWVDSATTTSDAGGLKITVSAVNQHHATTWTQYAGQRALAIETLTHYKLSGSGNQGGQDLSLEGNGTRHSEQYIAAPGTYLGAVSADTSSFTIMLTQMGMMIPATQRSVDTLTALP